MLIYLLRVISNRRSAFRSVRKVLCLALFLWVLLATTGAHSSDLETQVWGNFTAGWIRSEKLYLELDFEPKVQVSGGPKWRNLDVTPLVEYYPNQWVDLTGEMTVGRTQQSDDLRTAEVTLRAGLRLHLVKNVRHTLNFERRPLGRISAATLIRLEQRNFWYSDDTDSQHNFRLRLRLEFKMPINHADLTADRTFYTLADAEGYIPVGEETDERFATKLRGRVGLGYRINARKRVDLLYVLDKTRDTLEDNPSKALQAFTVRYKMWF